MLNQEQKNAVSVIDGPVMCLAGPGSGKTHTIIQRILHLIKMGIPPLNILVITFSKSAATELQNRFFSQTNGEYFPVTFGTFHAVFFHILNEKYHYKASDILSLSQKMEYMKTACVQSDGKKEPDEEEILQHLQKLAVYKNNAGKIKITLEEKNIYEIYKKICIENRKIDFEDMMLKCYEVLKTDSEICNFYRKKFQYIIVDEFQDINPIQYLILRILAKPKNNLMVVGDDDQSIYGFRGSKPQILLSFQKDFPNVKQIQFKKNYRSTKEIVKFSQDIICDNKIRYMKTFDTINEAGNKVEIIGFKDREEEYGFLVDKLRMKGVEYGFENIACLFRTNMDAAAIQERLFKEKIPCTMKEKAWNPYEHFIWMDFFHYLLLAKGDGTPKDFYAIMNKPLRYFSRNAMNGKVFSLEELYKFYKDKAYMKQYIDKFSYDLQMLRNMDFFGAINYIRRVIGYDEYLRKKAFEEGKESKEYLEIADLLQRQAAQFHTLQELTQHIDKYGMALKAAAVHKNGIRFMTFHGAKGLEFDCVYIMDCNEGIIPHKKSGSEEETEEERRMFYVAITRAKKELSIYYLKGTEERRFFPSRFISKKIKR